MSIIVVGRADIERVLTPPVALELVTAAMRRVSCADARHLVRRILRLPGPQGILGDMPGSLGVAGAFGLKCIAIRAAEQSQRAPHLGFLVLFEPLESRPIAVLEAGSITAIRTAAATALATRCLTPSSARTLGIFGAGEQAEYHLPALLQAWPFEEVRIWARRPEAAHALTQRVRQRSDASRLTLRHVSAREAAQSEVICTLTSSLEPVLLGEWVRPGTHVNLVGSSVAEACEADGALVAKSRYFVDSIESAQVHAAEWIAARNAGLVQGTHILGEIGAVSAGQTPGRLTESDITIYKSLGHIAQDLAVGWYVYERALAEGFGTTARF